MDDFDAAEPFNHAGKQAGRRVATRKDDLVADHLFIRKQAEFCLVQTRGRACDNSVRLREMIGPGVNGDANPFCADLADTHSLATAWRSLSEIIRAYRWCSFFLLILLQRKQFLDVYLQVAGKLEGDFGVRHIRAGFDCIDGLPRDADFPGKLRSADAPAFSDDGKIVLDAAHYVPGSTTSSWILNMRSIINQTPAKGRLCYCSTTMSC